MWGVGVGGVGGLHDMYIFTTRSLRRCVLFHQSGPLGWIYYECILIYEVQIITPNIGPYCLRYCHCPRSMFCPKNIQQLIISPEDEVDQNQ